MRYRTILLLLSIAFTGCNGNNGEITLDLTGTWTLNATLVSNTCGLPNTPLRPVEVTITQNGSRVTISGGGLEAVGRLEGNSLTIDNGNLTVTDPQSGCVLQVVFNMDATATETRITGTFSGDFDVDGAGCAINLQCSGTFSFTMTKM